MFGGVPPVPANHTEGRDMHQRRVVLGLIAGLALNVTPAAAQWQYTDNKGVTKVTQFKVDIPAPLRDGAVWVGPTGFGKPDLSRGQQETKARWDAYRRIGDAQAELVPYKQEEAAAAAAQRAKEARERREAAEAAQARRDALQAPSLRRRLLQRFF